MAGFVMFEFEHEPTDLGQDESATTGGGSLGDLISGTGVRVASVSADSTAAALTEESLSLLFSRLMWY